MSGMKFRALGEECRRLHIGPRRLRCRDSAGAVLLATGLVADNAAFQFRGTVTLVGRLAPAAGMRGRSQGLHRHRNETSGNREQQQQSGGQALHYSARKSSMRIDQL